MKYDLEKRTTDFSKTIIRHLKSYKDRLSQPLINQLVRSATSIGANYREANAASSKKDFRNKIAICRKEVQETKYWLELLAEAHEDRKEELKKIWSEAQELSLIFNKIYHTLKETKSKLNH